MIFTPVLHPLLLVPLAVLVIGAAVWALVRARGTDRALWAGRVALVVLCVLALLRPGLPGGTTQTLATDTDIVLMVDTTASSVAEDWDGEHPRLDGIRADVQKIIDHYPGARFALITFDASPQLRLPLTTDTNAVISSMDVLRPEVTDSSRGSSIGIAANLLTETLKNAASSSHDRSRMVFYLGDGEQTVSSSPESFASSKTFVDGGAVLGYGTAAGGRMRMTTSWAQSDPNPGYITYEGKDARSVIDEKNLGTIAEQLGVEYEHRTADAALSLPRPPTTTVSYSAAGETGSVIELYWIPVLAIILLLAFEVARATMLVTRMRGLTATRGPGGDA
ncbi:VWA domain-containing protein [Microbacterium gorillae]|uniref:VWA domain-containing protein n=1 Tax=Microbacterium gorillae TaxID=1231063 RepID=UPI00069443E6|nr:VWA domain-containing protein [Microbacterium gorillae]